jgi:hypothetical protein
VLAATQPQPTPLPGRGKGASRPCGTAGGGPRPGPGRRGPATPPPPGATGSGPAGCEPARHNDSRGISRIVTAPDAARRTVGTPPDLSTHHLRNRHANGDGQPTQAQKGHRPAAALQPPVAGIIHLVDYAVDETAHLARLRAGAGPPLIRAAVAAGVDSQWRPPPV